MKTNVLTPTQQHLLKLFSFNDSDEYALEVQEVLTRHFQERLDKEADRLWDKGILDQQRLDEIRTEDLHKTGKEHGTAGTRYWKTATTTY